MAISKTTRFEIFKRDKFQCVYCGRTPPSICLEVDHIEPVSRGGSDDPINLISACFDCNRGKGKRRLKNIPVSLATSIEAMKEKQLQVAAYNRFLISVKRRQFKNAQVISDIYTEAFPEWSLSDRFKNGSLASFLSRLPLESVREAMQIAVDRGLDSDRTIRYFCGICWRRINENAK